ncbi:MAG: rRNA large subunit methyltransferase I, partial [Peptococcaceae bacterium]|nr:rRNA large subunit methyltransferase I [Peptococcaceae bacterium]
MKHRVLAGHPWVYGTEVSEISGDFQPGDLVEVIDQRGRFVGRG